jgi:hypothetical protein
MWVTSTKYLHHFPQNIVEIIFEAIMHKGLKW